MKKIVLAAVVAAFTATPAFAANTDTEQGSATAEIVAPITLTHTPGAALNFGKFTADVGTVTISPAGAPGTTGAVVILSGSAVAADAFTVTGDLNRGYNISTTAGTISNGTTTLNFTTTPSAASATLSATGTGSFTVGGTLTVTGTATAGVYNGNYDATVTYN